MVIGIQWSVIGGASWVSLNVGCKWWLVRCGCLQGVLAFDFMKVIAGIWLRGQVTGK